MGGTIDGFSRIQKIQQHYRDISRRNNVYGSGCLIDEKTVDYEFDETQRARSIRICIFR
ncbi:hypothetical protein WH47_12438 [Habropoda laboriosa]|uniref:Uncharacterized protein n=1 Tax=Habropoda laboriosa TaxID=597456 RepID=A0A0L7QL76_9HYME|nr:hypothetical protein WH47_12438 [Habropoda laboriosa]